MSPASSNGTGPDSSSASTAQRSPESSETLPSSGQSHPQPATESSPSPAAHASGSGVGAPTGRKIERSCNLCHRRKIRCDKKSPCASCARGGFACFYPQAGQPIRRVRKTTIADVASRISDLEKTLTSAAGAGHHNRFGGPTSVAGTPAPSVSSIRPAEGISRPATAPPSGPFEKSGGDEILVRKGASSQYFDEVLISRVIEEEHDIQSVLTTPQSEPAPHATPSPFNPMGILSSPDLKANLADFLPPKFGAIELWRNYVDNVEVCNKIIHRPTAEVLIYTAIDDPSHASLDALALTFSVFFMSATVLEPATVQRITGEDKVTALTRFKTGLEQTFAKADFLEHPSVKLLEALAIYLAALRVHNPGRGLWTLNGLAIRAAQSIGLHRDGTRLGLSPFDSEIRRRLWWHLVARDGRASEDYGIQNPTSFNARVGVSFPSNLDDADLYPEMESHPRDRQGWTQMTLALINIRIARAWHRLAQIASDWDQHPAPSSVREEIVGELRDYAESFLRHCNPVIPHQRQTLLVARFIIRKVDLVMRQQWLHLEHPEARESFATEENLSQALEILEASQSLTSDELLRPYLWSMRSYPQYHMLLYALWHLCVKPEGPSVERAWRTVDATMEYARSAGVGSGPAAKMTILEALREKAVAIRQKLLQQGGEKEVVDKEAYPTPGAADDRSEAETSAAVMEGMTGINGVEGMDWSNMMQDFPDWNTLMTEFQVDGLAFPSYLD
ncbi:fungal specific transcription factor [Colletotrichum musicola]|uniref:Fungal specific transcription factor n=1 Tax=Colletotrichum musicola TaxID=2175873 RepID=A0A8H6MYZ3_9PEZI|nr:fungal specific transcription factor [Colletotrichum musicola]